MSDNMLRQVLNYFEKNDGPLSLVTIAQDMHVSPLLLISMIQCLVHQGYLREVTTGQSCDKCGIKGDCPFMVKMPRCYELEPEGEIIPIHDISQ